MKRYLVPSILVLCVGLLSGCATGRHTVVDTKTDYTADPTKALVIIMRTSSVGAAISSAVFDATGDKNDLIAVLGPKEKVAYYCPPGDRLFMVIAENADFMEATLEAGKIYYGIVTPRMGVWKARFSLHPFKVNHAEKEFRTDSPELRKWLSDCKYVRPNAAAEAYGKSSAGDIQARRAEYAPKWAAMAERDKQWRRLMPADGMDAPIQ